MTEDLPDTTEGAEEMLRRWKVYDQEMKAIIAAAGVHQDADSWWGGRRHRRIDRPRS
ncbi:MAG: hypothetical protein QHC90_07805 [Shinella sp.]|nr:hypothetical protein [Shinella sp.]